MSGRYTCVGGHDRCDQMYPGPTCPYCERSADREWVLAYLKSRALEDDGPLAFISIRKDVRDDLISLLENEPE